MTTPKELADKLMSVAQKIYTDKYKPGNDDDPAVMTQVIGVKDDELHPLPPELVHALFRNDFTKRVLSEAVDHALTDGLFDLVAVIGETFFVSYKKDEQIEDIPPSENPRRVQTLMVQVSSKDSVLTMMQKIEAGKLVGEPYALDGTCTGNLIPPSLRKEVPDGVQGKPH